MTCRRACTAASTSCSRTWPRSPTSIRARRSAAPGELHAQLHFGRFDELCGEGVTAFLDRFQVRLRDLGERIANDFLVPSG